MQAPYSADHLRPIPPLSPITGRAVEPNDRIHKLIFANRKLTAEESAELRAFEASAGEDQ